MSRDPSTQIDRAYHRVDEAVSGMIETTLTNRVVTCLGVFEPTVQNKAIDNIALFLGHRFPRVSLLHGGVI